MALALVGAVGCSGAEPDFHAESLTAAPAETIDSAPSPRGWAPLRERLSPTEIEQLISAEPVPEPFWPDDGALHYAPPPEAGAALRGALRIGRPVLVDVVSVEPPASDDAGSIAHARAVVTGEAIDVDVPAPGACAVTLAPSAGSRYLLLLDRDARGRRATHRLLSSGFAVLPVSPEGTVDADSLRLVAAAVDEPAAEGSAL